MERLSGPFGTVALGGALALFATLCVAPDDSSAAARKSSGRKAPAGPQCPVSGNRAIGVAKVLDGSTFLASDGSEIRLAGVTAPGAGGEPLSRTTADDARQSLARLLGAGALTLATLDGPPDRYGRIVAEVFADGAWVQGGLLKAGAVRMAPDRASGPCAAQLLAAEDEARATHAGHWGDGAFSLRTPDEIRNRAGSFQTVEGTVTSATTYKGRAYINFGADYRSDFTVTVAPQDMKLFRTLRFDVKKLAGKRVRVRGWVELYNGPEMEIATPAAIQTLD